MSWDRAALAALPLLLPVGFLGMMIGQTVWPIAVVSAVELGLLGLARRTDRRTPAPTWDAPSSTAERATPPRVARPGCEIVPRHHSTVGAVNRVTVGARQII